MDEPGARADCQMELIGGRLHQQDVARPAVADAAKVLGKSRLDISAMIAAQAVIPPDSFVRHSEDAHHQPDAIEAGRDAPALGTKGCADERAGPLGEIRSHRSAARIARQEVRAGKMRLTAKVGRIGEALDARRESLVAAFAKFDPATILDGSSRQVANP